MTKQEYKESKKEILARLTEHLHGDFKNFRAANDALNELEANFNNIEKEAIGGEYHADTYQTIFDGGNSTAFV
jgi:hypothetical protein